MVKAKPHAARVAGLSAVAAFLLLVPAASAQSMDIASEVLQPGDSYSFTFDEPGRFDYHCHVHPAMEGAVVVGPAGEAPQEHTVSIQGGFGGSFEPRTLTIAAGDTVIWTNDGSAPHQVWGAFEPEGSTQGPGDEARDTPGPGLVPLTCLLLVVGIARNEFKKRQRL